MRHDLRSLPLLPQTSDLLLGLGRVRSTCTVRLELVVPELGVLSVMPSSQFSFRFVHHTGAFFIRGGLLAGAIRCLMLTLHLGFNRRSVRFIRCSNKLRDHLNTRLRFLLFGSRVRACLFHQVSEHGFSIFVPQITLRFTKAQLRKLLRKQV
jgi:hypothetical protein